MHLIVEILELVLQVDAGKDVTDGLGSHLCLKIIAKFILRFAKLFVRKQLFFLKRGASGIRDHVLLVI